MGTGPQVPGPKTLLGWAHQIRLTLVGALRSVTMEVEVVDMTATAPGAGNRRGWWIAAAVLVVALVAAVVWWSAGDDEGGDGPAATTTTTDGSPSTTGPPTTTSPTNDASALWPAPGTSTRFDSPEAAARSFATEYLEFEAPVVGAFQAGDSRSGEVPVRPRDPGPVTTVLVRQLGPGSDWSVLGAASESIEVTSPTAGQEIASPVRVTGRAWTFEGNVVVQVRQDGASGPIGEGFVTGGGSELLPFEGSIPFETPGEPYGAVLFLDHSAENGQLWSASVVRVALSSTDADAATCGDEGLPVPKPGEGEMLVKAYFSCDAEDNAPEEPLRAVYRVRQQSPAVLQAALEVLLAGPSPAERDAGLGSWFSTETATMLRSVKIESGHAVVDFDDLRPIIPNASSSAGSRRLLAQLDATVFQFRTVASVEYRLEGDCEAFSEWLQYGGCEPRTRPASSD
jgi:hypothetical protein